MRRRRSWLERAQMYLAWCGILVAAILVLSLTTLLGGCAVLEGECSRTATVTCEESGRAVIIAPVP